MTVLYLKQPPHFSPNMEVVACFITCNEQILFLKRQLFKSEGDAWCAPPFSFFITLFAFLFFSIAKISL